MDMDKWNGKMVVGIKENGNTEFKMAKEKWCRSV
jgi:hypothetical protein